MIINRLKLENVGPFRGEHEIPLRTDSGAGKTIVLFGGKNGAGKTTIFEAIRLCLYGINALGDRQRRADYEQYLLDRIHRYKGLPIEPSQAAVELEFEYAHEGRVSVYQVRREWERRGNRAVQRLQVRRNGKPLDDIEADQWQDFLKELIPTGLAQLFIFDGEKIEELAAQDTDTGQFRDSFRSLLGFDLIERLQQDLAIHIARQERNADTQTIQHKLAAAHEDVTQLESQRNTTLRNRSQAQNEVDRLRKAIETQEGRLSAEGGGFATKRGELKQEAARIDDQIEEVEEQIRTMATGLLPFAMAPDYLRTLENRLLEETEIARLESANALLAERIEAASRRMRTSEFWSDLRLGKPTKERILDRLEKTLKEMEIKVDPRELIHPCSDVERARWLSAVQIALNDIPQELRKFTKRLESLHKKRQKIEEHLSKAPKEDVIAPIIERLNDLNKELGAAESQLKKLDEELRIVDFKLNAAKRTVDGYQEELEKAEGVSERIAVALRARKALEGYLERITQVKLEELSTTLADAFSRLSNKPGYYSRVEIDPESFAMIVYTRHGDKLTRDNLSAGERQIFATALLWALARTSGRPLPFIVDTPLGRLDHSHRENLVRYFFPEASHQVFILSTDAEIEGRYYKLLSRHIKHSYTLEHDADNGETLVKPGYAFREATVAVVQ